MNHIITIYCIHYSRIVVIFKISRFRDATYVQGFWLEWPGLLDCYWLYYYFSFRELNLLYYVRLINEISVVGISCLLEPGARELCGLAIGIWCLDWLFWAVCWAKCWPVWGKGGCELIVYIWLICVACGWAFDWLIWLIGWVLAVVDLEGYNHQISI